LPRRYIALMVLLAAALSAGSWFVRLPSRPAAVAPEPPIDIETPAGRARLDAAIALARMPDDPWTVAESMAAAPAAGDATESKSRCGEDQAPVFEAMPDADGVFRSAPVETRAAGVGYLGATRRIDAALRASADPFDRGVADALNIGNVLTPGGRLDALVQDAVTGSDPRTYALAFGACQRSASAALIDGPPSLVSASCAQLNAQEWARRDPGNGAPWVHALQQADTTGDQAAQREALRQLASSSRFDMRFGAGMAAVARLRMGDEDLAAQGTLVAQAVALSDFAPFQALTMRCRDKAGGDPDRVATCESIGEVLFEHSDAMITRAIGGAIHRLATGDSSRLDLAHQEERAYGAHWKPATGFSPCEDARQMLKRLAHVGAVGELAAMKEELRTPIPP